MTEQKRKVGRPLAGKVKLTCRILPETREKLGNNPGKRLDEILKDVRESR